MNWIHSSTGRASKEAMLLLLLLLLHKTLLKPAPLSLKSIRQRISEGTPSHSLIHDLNHVLGELHHGAIKTVDLGVDCAQPWVWVLDNLQWSLPL